METEYQRTKNGGLARINQVINPTPYSGLGKLPPQASDLEEAVLGGIMIEKEAILSVVEFLRGECFYRDNHQKIFTACHTLFTKGEPIDLLTIRSQLSKQGELEMVGGAYYLTELTDRVSSAANIEFHARIVYQKWLQREMIRINTESIQSAYEDTTDVLELIESNQSALFKLSTYESGKQGKSISDLLDDAIKHLGIPAVGNLTGVGTGFVCLDDFTAGWQKSEFTILAARPAMGKTALMMQLARNAAVVHGVPTAVFSLEMSEMQLTNRMISNETEIFLEKINKKTITDYDWQSLDDKLYNLRNSPLHVDDTPAITINQFRAKCIRLKRLFNIGFVVIDYLQLMRGDVNQKGNRDQEIGQITRGIKAVAKELNIPIIALSQLNRGVEDRPGAVKRPRLSDLRESGNIEQDADNVYFLFRPEYYGITADENNNSTAQMAELICAKNRSGPTQTLYLKFRGAVMRFENWVNTAAAQITTQFTPINEREDLPTNFVIKPTSLFDNDEAPF